MNSFTVPQLEEAAAKAGQTLVYCDNRPVITQEMAYHLDPPPWARESKPMLSAEKRQSILDRSRPRQPEDVNGECNAHLYIGDDWGDNSSTMRCSLLKGHDGPHVERFRETVEVRWEVDERDYAAPAKAAFTCWFQTIGYWWFDEDTHEAGGNTIVSPDEMVSRFFAEFPEFLPHREAVLKDARIWDGYILKHPDRQEAA